MNKPLILRAISALENFMGRENFTSLLDTHHRTGLALSGQGRMLRGILRRILTATGLDASPARIEALVNECVLAYTSNQVSLFTIDPREAALAVKTVDLALLPSLRETLKKGKGVILAGPHSGNQVLAMTALSLAGVPVNVIFINADPYRWVAELGIYAVNLGQAALECLRALSRNEVVILYTDLDYFPGGRTMDFFGAPIRPPHAPARLALASGAPLLPFYTLHKNGRHSMVCGEPIEPQGKTQEELESAILRYQERAIGKDPGSWWNSADLWDMEATERRNRDQLTAVMTLRQVKYIVKNMLGRLSRLFR